MMDNDDVIEELKSIRRDWPVDARARKALDLAISEMESADRPGRRCWFRMDGKWEYVDSVRTFVVGPWNRGYFHIFGAGHIEYEYGPGPYLVAVVEDEFGKVSVASAENVNFGEDKPS
jgi:hypothetical protein